MKTVSVSSRKAAHFEPSAEVGDHRVIYCLIGNRSFVHFLLSIFFFIQYKLLAPASGSDSFIYSGMKIDLFNRP